MTWLRSVDRLARSGPSEVADAHLQLRELARIARALLPHVRHDGPCEPGRCRLATAHSRGAELCRLVPTLAALDVATGPHPTTDPDALIAELAHAVAASVDVVRWCRQTAHPNGACWFLSAQGGDCAPVLKLAHELART